MTKLWKSVWVLWAIGMGLGMSGVVLGATGVGPYYATPSWDQTLPASTRFIVLTNMGSAAVLDRETGLVWEQVPSIAIFIGARSGGNADTHIEHCVSLTIAGRRGWRVPSVQELLSLTDPTQTNPVLPAGHPFIVNLPIDASDVGDWFWTATPYDFGDGSPALRLVSLRNGALPRAGTANAIFKFRVWCVRGGSGNPNQ